MTKKNLTEEEIANSLVDILLEYEPGTQTTTEQLFDRYFEKSDDFDLSEVDSELRWIANSRGLYLDSSAYHNAEIGLSCDIPFKVCKQDHAAVDLNNIRYLSFSISCFFTGSEYIGIMKDESNDVVLNHENIAWGQTENSINDFMQPVNQVSFDKLLNSLKTAKVNQWKKHYETSCLDGFQWGLIICDSDNRCICVDGSNGVPKGFDIVFEALQSLGLSWEGPFEPDWTTEGYNEGFPEDYYSTECNMDVSLRSAK